MIKKFAIFLSIVLGVSFTSNGQLVRDTTLHKGFIRQTIIPAALLTYGLISLENKPLRQFDRYVKGAVLNDEHFSSMVDNYLRYAPIAAVYGMNAMGLKGSHRFIDRTLILGIATSFVSGAVSFAKDKVEIFYWCPRSRDFYLTILFHKLSHIFVGNEQSYPRNRF